MSVRFLGRTKALLAATALTATMAVGCTVGSGSLRHHLPQACSKTRTASRYATC